MEAEVLPKRYGLRLLYFLIKGATALVRGVYNFTFLVTKMGVLAVSRKRLVHSTESHEPKRVVMLVVSMLSFDPRVERAARVLAVKGFNVNIICPLWSHNQEDVQLDWGRNIAFHFIPSRPSFYHFPFLFDRKMYKAALASNAWAFHCHDLNTCLIGLAAAARINAHCVCDFHEWFSENISWNKRKKRWISHPWYKRLIFKAAERLVMLRATAVITVCDTIAESLRHACNTDRDIYVVRNVPIFESSSKEKGADLRKITGAGPEKFILLYQGGVGPSRYIEPIIKAMKYAPRAVFVIRGPGIEWYRKDYRRLASSLGIAERVFCLDPVPSQRVVIEAASANAGIWSLENLCKNFQFALPNKVFEYLAAGLPILVADYPETRKLVKTHGVGLCFDPDSPLSIAEAINRLANDPELRQRCKNNIPAALSANQPEREWAKLLTIYKDIQENHRL